LWLVVKSRLTHPILPTVHQIDRLDEIGFQWETEKSIKAERLRAEREAFETNRREQEAIRIRQLQIQQLASAKKSSLARAVLPLKRSPPKSASRPSKARRPSPSRPRRRGGSGDSSDTEEDEGDGEYEGDGEETGQEEGSDAGEDEDGSTVASAEVVARCSRVDYDSDGGDDKVVVASIVWDSPPPGNDQG
jgi:hypothetical protein